MFNRINLVIFYDLHTERNIHKRVWTLITETSGALSPRYALHYKKKLNLYMTIIITKYRYGRMYQIKLGFSESPFLLTLNIFSNISDGIVWTCFFSKTSFCWKLLPTKKNPFWWVNYHLHWYCLTCVLIIAYHSKNYKIKGQPRSIIEIPCREYSRLAYNSLSHVINAFSAYRIVWWMKRMASVIYGHARKRQMKGGGENVMKIDIYIFWFCLDNKRKMFRTPRLGDRKHTPR